MIQMNLLPDLKMQYIKAQRQMRLFSSIAILLSVLSIVILVIFVSINLLQKKHLKDIQRDIHTEISQLQNKPQINKVLTVQNQLNSLTTLHNAKPNTVKVADYLNDITPSNIFIKSFTIDFTKYTVTINGFSDSLASVNKFIDTIKFTNYTISGSPSALPAFSSVILSNFGTNTSTTDAKQNSTFVIGFSYDKTIFDITKSINLLVPNQITTRSQIDQPSPLFTTPSSNNSSGGGN